MSLHENYLTTKQVAHELQVSVATIYKYIKEKKLIPVYKDDWQIDETHLFKPEDIKALKEKFKKPGLTTGEVAKRLQVHPTTVSSYIKKGKLRATKQLYKGRQLYFIDEADVKAFQGENGWQRKRDQKLFYSKETNLYLFQTVTNEETSEIGRIIELNGKEGKILTEAGHVFPLKQMQEMGFIPKEQFIDHPYITKRGYVKFQFEKPSFIGSPVFHVIELFYREIGYRNIRLTENKDTIMLEVKPIFIKSFSIETNQYVIELLRKTIQEGDVKVRHNGLLLESDVEPLTIHVPSKLKRQIKQAAKLQHLTIDEFVVQILKAHVGDNS